MALQPCLTEPITMLSDTSVVINLNATGCADAILRALPHRVAVIDIVQGELDAGTPRERNDAALIGRLVDDGLIKVVSLDETASLLFETLVIGPSAITLDDGEAATIAYAVANGATAVIDEKKANRICAERFPELTVICTVDLLAHPAVRDNLGDELLADAVYGALYNGRMRVPLKHRAWVVELIGVTRATECVSLPRSVRVPHETS
jgi:predicted nucleic acid-binding protein